MLITEAPLAQQGGPGVDPVRPPGVGGDVHVDTDRCIYIYIYIYTCVHRALLPGGYL